MHFLPSFASRLSSIDYSKGGQAFLNYFGLELLGIIK